MIADFFEKANMDGALLRFETVNNDLENIRDQLFCIKESCKYYKILITNINST
jgi:hypothetical protein